MDPEWLALAVAATQPRLLIELYGDLAKPGVAQVGKALSTVLGLGNTILLPIQLLNERARILVEANVERYREKLARTPENDICPVRPEVGVPVVEKLSYVSDPDLRELYTTLLAKASTYATQSQAHPSFVNIINNLSPDEAQLVRQFLQEPVIPFVQPSWTDPKTGIFLRRGIHIALLPSTRLAFKVNLPAYISNLEGLGLIDVEHDVYSGPEEVYVRLETECEASRPRGYTQVACSRGTIEITHFGWLFMQCCIGEQPSEGSG